MDKKPKIITLVGKSNAGKTSALKKLILELAGAKGENLIDVPEASGYSTFISPQEKEKLYTLKHSTGDRFVNVKVGSIKIGISTAGDNYDGIKYKFDLLKENCDFFVCASKHSGVSFEYINELEKEYSVTRLYKIGCRGNEEDWKYNVIKEYSDILSVNEIIKCIKDINGGFEKND